MTHVVKYFSDPSKTVEDQKTENSDYFIESERPFSDPIEALRFLDSCTQPITKVEDIIKEYGTKHPFKNSPWKIKLNHLHPKNVSKRNDVELRGDLSNVTFDFTCLCG